MSEKLTKKLCQGNYTLRKTLSLVFLRRYSLLGLYEHKRRVSQYAPPLLSFVIKLWNKEKK